MGSRNEDQGRHQKIAGRVSAWQQVRVKSSGLSPAVMAAESRETELRYRQGAQDVEACPGSGRQLGNGTRGSLTPQC